MMTPLVGNTVISLFNVRLEKDDKIIIKKGEKCKIKNVYFEDGRIKIQVKQAGVDIELDAFKDAIPMSEDDIINHVTKDDIEDRFD